MTAMLVFVADVDDEVQELLARDVEGVVDGSIQTSGRYYNQQWTCRSICFHG